MVEDRRARPMLSEGADLIRWMMKRMSVAREDYYLDYVLKCYPNPKVVKSFGNKAFRTQMIEACAHYRLATLQLLKPKAIVVMGATACEAFLGSEKVGEYEGARWIPNEPFVRESVEGIWITYAPGYALKGPSESVGIYRTLFAAAEEAGLKPKLNKQLEPFDYGT